MLADDLVRDARLRFAAGQAPRIAIAMLWQETNSFNPVATIASDFLVDRGNALLTAYADSATTLGGMIRTLVTMGAELVPILAAKARPGGPIDDAFAEGLLKELVDEIGRARPDAVCLELHGSMTSHAIDDIEGELLARLRAALGPRVPIVAGLDLHGNCTARMVDCADFLTAYRTQPHADMVETGERAASVLAAILMRGLTPHASRISLPFLALTNDETGNPPMRSVWAEAEAAISTSKGRTLDLSIFNVHPFLDVPEMGQTVLAYADGEGLPAEPVARRVAAALDKVKADFSGSATSIEEILAQIAVEHGAGETAVIGDQGDSVLAGTPGDSVEIARVAATSFGSLRGFIPLFDPETVRIAQGNGIGAMLPLRLGASVSPRLSPFKGEGVVERLTDGRFVNSASYMAGVLNDLGDCAVIHCGSLVFLVTTKAPVACDPAMIEHAGYDPSDFDFLVMKSSNHFKLSFTPPFRCFVAGTAGLSSRDPSLLRHSRAALIFPATEGRRCERTATPTHHY